MDTREVAHRFLQRDLRHRVALYVSVLPDKFDTGFIHPNFEGSPKFGCVKSISEVPACSVLQHTNHNRWDRFIHYVYETEILYVPCMPWSGAKGIDDPVFLIEGASYLMSPRLFEVLWGQLQHAEQLFPKVPGMELKTSDSKSKDLKVLEDAGYYVQMAGFTKKGTPLGKDRLISEGFVSQFGFPGEEPRVVNKLEVSESLILSLQESQPSCRDATVVDVERTEFLRGLKEMCYGVQSEHGPFAAKYAWEVYKRTARFISSREEGVS